MSVKPKVSLEEADDTIAVLSDFAMEFLLIAMFLGQSDISDELREAGIGVSDSLANFAELLRKEAVSE